MRHYSIGEVCEILKIKPHILRYWEKEIELLTPVKDRSGRRIYSFRDIQLLFRLRYLIYTKKYTVEGAKKKLLDELDGKQGNLKAEIMLQRDNLLSLLSKIKEEQKKADSFLPEFKQNPAFNPIVVTGRPGSSLQAERISRGREVYPRISVISLICKRDRGDEKFLSRTAHALLELEEDGFKPAEWRVLVSPGQEKQIKDRQDISGEKGTLLEPVIDVLSGDSGMRDIAEYCRLKLRGNMAAFDFLPQPEFAGAFVQVCADIGCPGQFISSREEGIFLPEGGWIVNRDFFVETVQSSDNNSIRQFTDFFGYTDKSMVYVIE
ncbi:MAG: MerR family transcriptional regulator [Spirochaetia bacterium]